jgi:hypothetical protein
MIKAGDRVWYGMDAESCVSFVAEVGDAGEVRRLWAVSRLAGGIVWVENPPQSDGPTPGAWWPLVAS